LCSKLTKYNFKNFIDHSVSSQVEELKKIILSKEGDYKELDNKVSSIIQNQKQNPRYDYMTNEQIEIDKLVYDVYNLNEEDIQEVENWYFRRYPKLAQVIEDKLKGKDNAWK